MLIEPALHGLKHVLVLPAGDATLLACGATALSFMVAGVPVDRNAFVSETNLDYAVTSAMTAGLSYSSQTVARRPCPQARPAG